MIRGTITLPKYGWRVHAYIAVSRYYTEDILKNMEALGAKEKHLADALNGTIAEGDYRFMSSALVAHIQDSDKYEGAGAKWNVDIDAMCEKIKKLSCVCVEAIYRRVEEYWRYPEDLDTWAEY